MNYSQRWNVRFADASLNGYLQPKHNSHADYGYPANPQFKDFYDLYQRNGLARAGVDKTVGKTWQDFPFLLEKPRDGGQSRKETGHEKRIRQRFDDLRIWQKLADADRRGMVGAYAGVIFRLADSKAFDQPVTGAVPGGLNGLAEIIPAWEGQLTVSLWDTNQQSVTYSQPLMYQFNEASVGNVDQPRSFQVHPDRVMIWSRDGTIHGESQLKPGMNDALAAAKIIGAGGEGFWKNAKSAPVLQAPPEANFTTIAKALGCTVDELFDLMNQQVEDYQRGFDQMLMLQGMEAKSLGIVLPSPEHFFSIACQSLAASFMMPVKILVGMQTGERASTEDAEEWASTNMSRRSSETIPNIMAFVRRLERFGMIPERDWSLAWTPLTEAKPGEKIDRAVKMVTANKDSVTATQERVFTNAEIRAAAGDFEPLSEADAKVEPPAPEPTDPTADPAADPPPTGQE